MSAKALPLWSLAAPAAAWALLAAWFAGAGFTGPLALVAGLGLLGAVLAAVHHAEILALKLGEPFGTLLLALAVTVIEAGLIVTLMLADPEDTTALARDTVFAAVMIILTGVVGLCLMAGAARHHVQRFTVHGVNAALTTLAVLAVSVLVLPNFTVTTPGSTYAPSQLALIGLVSLLLYGTFVLVQTVRHRDYFLSDTAEDDVHSLIPSNRDTALAGLLLVVALVAVVLLAKALSPAIEANIDAAGAPKAALGVVIAALVLLPESVAAWSAARANRLQTSLNLALGSALATIGLTIPVIAALSLWFGWTLTLGLDPKEMVLLALTLLVSAISLATGRTTVMQGAAHLVLFALFLFLTFVP
ncbi:calcium:proton antiporter [Sandaracinobacteroides saxicola]|uniref:Ionic transporter y4hA n=1 Tax=Sandaracinobacteroides saxicola TaxID=2759707 RepID=A0A7G5IH50_9SPHN|nr:ionic transporter y4hA [Sandaracinobacteroides saxicola]QMW22692.1 ionic transporter y4hA [Sandaracinobacteroides saxicola]